MGKRFVPNLHVFNRNLAPPRQHQRAAAKTDIRLGVGRAQQIPPPRKAGRALARCHVGLAMRAVDLGAEHALHLVEHAVVAVGQRASSLRQGARSTRCHAGDQVARRLLACKDVVLRRPCCAVAHHHGLANSTAQRLLGAKVKPPQAVREGQPIGQGELAHKPHSGLVHAHGGAAIEYGLRTACCSGCCATCLQRAHCPHALHGVGPNAQLGSAVNRPHHQQITRHAQAIDHRLDLAQELAQPVLRHLLLRIHRSRDARTHLFGRPAIEHQQVLNAPAVQLLHGVAGLSARAADGGGLLHGFRSLFSARQWIHLRFKRFDPSHAKKNAVMAIFWKKFLMIRFA